LKVTPELRFEEDDLADTAAAIDRLLDQVHHDGGTDER
jgi:ribosome-binding factor A